jgi:hypothetical protein
VGAVRPLVTGRASGKHLSRLHGREPALHRSASQAQSELVGSRGRRPRRRGASRGEREEPASKPGEICFLRDDRGCSVGSVLRTGRPGPQSSPDPTPAWRLPKGSQTREFSGHRVELGYLERRNTVLVTQLSPSGHAASRLDRFDPIVASGQEASSSGCGALVRRHSSCSEKRLMLFAM